MIDDWRSDGDFTAADYSQTWELGTEAYLAVRDILRDLTESNWAPGTVM